MKKASKMRVAKTIFLDFDHTLFNTDEFFHVDVRNAFRNFGVDTLLWEKALFKVLPTGYTLEKHIAEAEKQSGAKLPIVEMKAVLNKNFSDLRKYLFPDVKSFLTKARKSGALYLLSFGDPGWQEYKINGSGISDSFDDIFFTAKEGTKADAIIEHSIDFTQTIMVDNNPAELDAIKDKAPGVKTYCINRVPGEIRNPQSELARLKFLEARKYLDKLYIHKHIPCRTLDEIILKF